MIPSDMELGCAYVLHCSMWVKRCNTFVFLIHSYSYVNCHYYFESFFVGLFDLKFTLEYMRGSWGQGNKCNNPWLRAWNPSMEDLHCHAFHVRLPYLGLKKRYFMKKIPNESTLMVDHKYFSTIYAYYLFWVESSKSLLCSK